MNLPKAGVELATARLTVNAQVWSGKAMLVLCVLQGSSAFGNWGANTYSEAVVSIMSLPTFFYDVRGLRLVTHRHWAAAKVFWWGHVSHFSLG